MMAGQGLKCRIPSHHAEPEQLFSPTIRFRPLFEVVELVLQETPIVTLNLSQFLTEQYLQL